MDIKIKTTENGWIVETTEADERRTYLFAYSEDEDPVFNDLRPTALKAYEGLLLKLNECLFPYKKHSQYNLPICEDYKK